MGSAVRKFSITSAGSSDKVGSVIIQCPACQTKFAIEREILSNINDPKFHCSRCDHVFTTDFQSVQTPLMPSAEVSASLQGGSYIGGEGGSHSYANPAGSGLEAFGSSQLRAPGIDGGWQAVSPDASRSVPPVESSDIDYRVIDHKAALTRKMEATREPPSKRLEIPRTLSGNISWSPPHEVDASFGELERQEFRPSLSGESQMKLFPSSLMPPVGALQSSARAATRAKIFSSAQVSRELTHGAAPRNATDQVGPSSANGEVSQAEPRKRWSLAKFGRSILPGSKLGVSHGVAQNMAASSSAGPSHRMSAEFSSELASAGTLLPGAQTQTAAILGHSQQRSGFSLFLYTLLGVVAVLGLVMLLSTSLPAMRNRLAGWLYPSAPIAAPSGLEISEATYNQFALDNGEVVDLISGKIINRSDMRLRHIVIEGLLYDRAGERLASSKALAGSGLTRARIKALTPEIIEALQTGQVARKFDLRPGQSMEFNIALFRDPVTRSVHPRSFSATIHSVLPVEERRP